MFSLRAYGKTTYWQIDDHIDLKKIDMLTLLTFVTGAASVVDIIVFITVIVVTMGWRFYFKKSKLVLPFATNAIVHC